MIIMLKMLIQHLGKHRILLLEIIIKTGLTTHLLMTQTFGKFYQGLIKAKGTSNVMKPFNRSLNVK